MKVDTDEVPDRCNLLLILLLPACGSTADDSGAGRNVTPFSRWQMMVVSGEDKRYAALYFSALMEFA